jgi:hypothetical protein
VAKLNDDDIRERCWGIQLAGSSGDSRPLYVTWTDRCCQRDARLAKRVSSRPSR